MIVLVDTPYEAICYPAAKLFAETIFRSRQIYYRIIDRIIRRIIRRSICRILQGDTSFLVDFQWQDMIVTHSEQCSKLIFFMQTA